MQTSLQPVSAVTESLPVLSQPGRAVLRREGGAPWIVARKRGRGSRPRSLIKNRGVIGTLAILTAVTVVGASILQHGLSPDTAVAQHSPLFRLSALFLARLSQI